MPVKCGETTKAHSLYAPAAPLSIQNTSKMWHNTEKGGHGREGYEQGLTHQTVVCYGLQFPAH